jgi:hypothetical protein
LRGDGGIGPTALGDDEDGTRSSNNIKLVQLSHAGYIQELNKYNTTF